MELLELIIDKMTNYEIKKGFSPRQVYLSAQKYKQLPFFIEDKIFGMKIRIHNSYKIEVW